MFETAKSKENRMSFKALISVIAILFAFTAGCGGDSGRHSRQQ